MKKVLFVIRELCGGGAERALSNIVTHFPADWEIDILLNNRNDIDYSYKGRILSLDIPEPKKRSSILHQAKAIIKRAYLLRKLKKENSYAACISFLDSSNISNVLSGNKYCKTIISIRGNVTSDKLSKLYRRSIFILMRTLYQKADKIVTVSQEIQEEIVECFSLDRRKVAAVRNGYDSENIVRAKQEKLNEKEYEAYERNRLVITAGRLDRLKGQWHLIRAFNKVAKELPDIKLVILGEGELKDYLQELVKGYGIEDKVIFEGFVSNPFKILNRGDLFVLPSLSEGFPNALAEALYCGLPCIAADFHSGAREILAPGMRILGERVQKITEAEYGVLVPVLSGIQYDATEPLEQQEQSLADAIFMLLTDHDKNDYFRKKSEERSKDLGIGKIVKEWIQVIEE